MSPFLGIDVEFQFCSRAEMVALGIRSHWFKGIDYMGAKYGDKVIF
jgi:[histone H3]-lysine9 N-trimethyltransferase EHMT